MAELFNKGDVVVWVGPRAEDGSFTVGNRYGIVDVDIDDPDWPYLLTDDHGDPYWVRGEAVSLPTFPAPPKFQTLEEAEAWLETQATTGTGQADTAVTETPFDPFGPAVPVGEARYLVTISKLTRPDAATVLSEQVFQHTVKILPGAPAPVRTALEGTARAYEDQPF